MANDTSPARFIFLANVPDYSTTFSENPSIKRKFSIGSNIFNDFIIWDQSVSSFHAVIQYQDGVFRIEDKSIFEGTLV